MAMTREEAKEWFLDHMPLKNVMPTSYDAYSTAIAALRPVSREQVEQMRGEWLMPIFSGQEDENDPRCQCSECGSIETPLARHRFCPACGAPMTDEAVQMVMERLEAMRNG